MNHWVPVKHKPRSMSLSKSNNSSEGTNLPISFSKRGLEDAERRYQELFEAEKQRLLKKEQ